MLLPFGTHGLPFADCSGKFILSQVILRFISSDTAVSFKAHTETYRDEFRSAAQPACITAGGRVGIGVGQSFGPGNPLLHPTQ